MKKHILSLAIITIVAGTAFTACQSSGEKVENAQEDVQKAENKVADARQELNEATSDSIAEYKRDTREKIAAHEKSIAEFKARIANDKKENKAKYDKKIADLEQKDTDLKKKLDDFKADGKDQWEKFKTEFNHDLDEFGKSVKNLSVKNSR